MAAGLKGSLQCVCVDIYCETLLAAPNKSEILSALPRSRLHYVAVCFEVGETSVPPSSPCPLVPVCLVIPTGSRTQIHWHGGKRGTAAVEDKFQVVV